MEIQLDTKTLKSTRLDNKDTLYLVKEFTSYAVNKSVLKNSGGGRHRFLSRKDQHRRGVPMDERGKEQ